MYVAWPVLEKSTVQLESLNTWAQRGATLDGGSRKRIGYDFLKRILSAIALLIVLHVNFVDPYVQDKGEKFVHPREGLEVNWLVTVI